MQFEVTLKNSLDSSAAFEIVQYKFVAYEPASETGMCTMATGSLKVLLTSWRQCLILAAMDLLTRWTVQILQTSCRTILCCFFLILKTSHPYIF